MRPLSASVAVSGQVSVDDLQHLKQAGYAVVVNHRPDHEESGQPTSAALAEEAHRLGLDYVWIPVAGMPDRAAVEATSAILERTGETTPVFMFCRSGMRSSAAWAMATCARGGDADEVRAAAAAAGYDLSRLPL